MTMVLDQTHDPARKSWLASANQAGSDFPLQNLPFGIFRLSSGGRPRAGVAIGDRILDLAAALEAGCLELPAHTAAAAQQPALNALMAEPVEARRALRLALSNLLSEGSALAGDR
ncbi:MAG: fumarylacetoacetase, partial [Gemmatimonadota bacterium]|nr:fumarylacetoacetase [Gemmatimonadota bacterium]